MASGEAAAKAVLEAKKKGDFSAKGLSCYQRLLNEGFVMKDLKRFRKLNHFADSNPEVFDGYFRAITQMAVDYFSKSEMPKRQQELQMLKRFRATLRELYISRSGGTYRHNRLTRALYAAFPLARFIWQCLKGGIAFI